MSDGNAFDGLMKVYDELMLLLVSGAGGAYFRAAMAPEKEYRKRIVQGIAGGLSAVFLGGLVAHYINLVLDVGSFAYLAAGFLMGSGGELTVKKLQDRILGRPANGTSDKPK